MTDRLSLDTHIVLWLDSGDDRLDISTRALIDGCWQNSGTIFLSAVSAWEIGYSSIQDTLSLMFLLRRGSAASLTVLVLKLCH